MQRLCVFFIFLSFSSTLLSFTISLFMSSPLSLSFYLSIIPHLPLFRHFLWLFFHSDSFSFNSMFLLLFSARLFLSLCLFLPPCLCLSDILLFYSPHQALLPERYSMQSLNQSVMDQSNKPEESELKKSNIL